jgi:hypothetical protein
MLALLVAITGCTPPPTPTSPSEVKAAIQPGGIYSCKSGEGDFCAVKVLVVKDGAVHARLHKNRYKERPTTIDPKELQVAIGHVPLSEEGFSKWELMLLVVEEVADAELEGYRLWKNR